MTAMAKVVDHGGPRSSTVVRGYQIRGGVGEPTGSVTLAVVEAAAAAVKVILAISAQLAATSTAVSPDRDGYVLGDRGRHMVLAKENSAGAHPAQGPWGAPAK